MPHHFQIVKGCGECEIEVIICTFKILQIYNFSTKINVDSKGHRLEERLSECNLMNLKPRQENVSIQNKLSNAGTQVLETEEALRKISEEKADAEENLEDLWEKVKRQF